MRKVLLTLLTFTLVHSLFSQQDAVLKNFKYRIDHYQAVTLYLGAGGQYSRTDFAIGTGKNSSATGNGGGSYYFEKSTDRILFNVLGSLNGAFGTAHADNSTNDAKNKSVYSTAYLDLSNKWFSKKFFIELGVDANSLLNSSKSTATNPVSSYKSQDFSQGIGITGGIGQGRLENVTDMQNALWLYKSLKAENKLSRELSQDEMNELGRTVTRANNTRILDARRKTIYMLETVDRFFQQKGLVNGTDIRYFSNLNDILMFAFNYPRLSGTEKFIRVTPSIYHFNRDQKENGLNVYQNDLTTKAVNLSVGISRYHPVNLTHQNNMGASLIAKYIDHSNTDKFYSGGVLGPVFEMTPVIKQAALSLFFQHALYPNTRTVVSAGINSETGMQDVDGESDFYATVDLNTDVSYFISYRTRFNFSLGARYQKEYFSFSPYFQSQPNHFQLTASAGVVINL